MKQKLNFGFLSLTILAIILACFLPFHNPLKIYNNINDFYTYSSILNTTMYNHNTFENVNNINATSSIFLNNSTKYNSWGADDIGIDTYTTYLDDIEETKKHTTYVAVLDTGVDTDHPYLSGRIDYTYARKYSYDSTTQKTSTFDGKTYVEDLQGHGTHVSGIITDLTPANVQIIPIKVIEDDNTGNLYSAVLALNYLAELKATQGINICAANLSLGSTGTVAVGSSFYNTFSEAVQTARAQNISVVVSAGNSSDDCINYSPANIAEAITVSNTTKFHTKSTSSCYGSCVDLTAPGENIYSTTINGGFKYLSGTSMSAPHVSACVAMLNIYNYTENYTVTNVENLLLNNAIDLGDTNWDGKGLVSLSNLTINNSLITPTTYTIRLNLDQNVQLSTDSDLENIKPGSSIQFRVTVKKGYDIAHILVNGKEYFLSENILIIENIQSDTTINITTEEIGYDLDLNFIIAISIIGVGVLSLIGLGVAITKRSKPY